MKATSQLGTDSPGSAPVWDSVVLEYERRVEPFTSSFISELIEPFQASSPPCSSPKKLLDVGCGTGLGASIASDAGFDVTPCDVSSSMIQRVQARFPHLAAHAICVDGQSLPFENEFDYAMGAFSVIFFSSPLAGLKQIWNALVDGGEVAISAWGDADETPAFQIFQKAMKSMSSIETDESLEASAKPKRITGSPETLTALLQEAGYECVRVKGPIKRYIQVPNAEEFYNRFALTSPNIMNLLEKLDDIQTSELKSRVMSLALEQSNSKECISIPASCYFAYGKKIIKQVSL